MSVRFGDFVFHGDRRQLVRSGADVHLTPKAFDLLALLIERAPAVVRKTDIHECLWPGTFVSDSTLLGLVKELRRALGDDRSGNLIRTAHRVGYAFAGVIQPHAPEQRGIGDRMAGWRRGRRFALHEGVNVIGRDPDATVWLDVVGVSRRHAHVIVENGVASLEDLGSKNGTLVADRPVRDRVVLRDADRIQIATELLVFHTAIKGRSTVTQAGRTRSERRPAETMMLEWCSAAAAEQLVDPVDAHQSSCVSVIVLVSQKLHLNASWATRCTGC